MKYIVHGSKKQNDSQGIKVTLKQNLEMNVQALIKHWWVKSNATSAWSSLVEVGQNVGICLKIGLQRKFNL